MISQESIALKPPGSLAAAGTPESPDGNKGHPLASVIIPTYDRAWSLRKGVESVFEQTYRPIECLVIDDGSTDDTAEVMAQLAKEKPDGVDLRYFVKENGGANSARNRGLVECRGEFICFLDSDDELVRDSIEVRARVLIEEPDVGLCYGLASVRDDQGNEVRIVGEPWPAASEARIAPYLFCSSAPLVRRRVCFRAGPWWEADAFGQEYEYFARLKCFAGRVVSVDRVLSVYLRHDRDSIFDNSSHPFSLAIFKVLLAVKALIVYGPHDSLQERRSLATAFRSLAKQLHRLRDYQNACSALAESLSLKYRWRVFAEWLVLGVLRICRESRCCEATSDSTHTR